jgi:hypothetical protein
VPVLPYRFGTHAGWLQAYLDLWTAPSRGFYGEQRFYAVFDVAEETFDPESLLHAAHVPYGRRIDGTAAARASCAQRRVERVRLAQAPRLG